VQIHFHENRDDECNAGKYATVDRRRSGLFCGANLQAEHKQKGRKKRQ